MAPKKAVKKAAAKMSDNHGGKKDAQDARRTFEHLGRVRSILSRVTGARGAIQSLVSVADHNLCSQHYRESANLLRAAEHLSFADLLSDDRQRVSPDLLRAIEDELSHLLDRAREHGEAEDAPTMIRELYGRMTSEAKAALRRGSYGAALELARGAEALTHVRDCDVLGGGQTREKLEA
jgi:hypothetical protein